jgi:hypothetical protein
MTELEQELRYAVEDAIVGEPLRPGLGERARSAAVGVLHRHNIRSGRVVVRRQGAGFVVEVILPPGPARVQQVVLRFAAG